MAQGGLQVIRTAFALCLAASLNGDDLLVSFKDEHYVREVVSVSQERFTEVEVMRKAQAFLDTYRSITFARLDIAPDDAGKWLSGKGGDDLTLENFFYRLKDLRTRTPHLFDSVASLIKVGHSAVLRMRNEGRVKHITLNSSAAPAIDILGDPEILFIAPLFESTRVSGIEVFARTRQEPTKEIALDLAKAVARLKPEFEVFVLLRADPWFPLSSGFPFVYPFDEHIKDPTEAEYRKGCQVIVSRP